MARRLIEEDKAACMDIDPSTFPLPSAPPPPPQLTQHNKEQSLADIMAAVSASARAEELAELKEIEKKATSKVTKNIIFFKITLLTIFIL